jgi:hypothetical protein
MGHEQQTVSISAWTWAGKRPVNVCCHIFGANLYILYIGNIAYRVEPSRRVASRRVGSSEQSSFTKKVKCMTTKLTITLFGLVRLLGSSIEKPCQAQNKRMGFGV